MEAFESTIVLAESQADFAGDLNAFLGGRHRVRLALDSARAMDATDGDYDVLILAEDFGRHEDSPRDLSDRVVDFLLRKAVGSGRRVIMLGKETRRAGSAARAGCILLDRFPGPAELEMTLERMLPANPARDKLS